MRQNLGTDMALCTSIRFAMVVNYNLLVRRGLVYLDWDSVRTRASPRLCVQDRYASAAKLVLSVRHLLFYETKVAFLSLYFYYSIGNLGFGLMDKYFMSYRLESGSHCSHLQRLELLKPMTNFQYQKNCRRSKSNVTMPPN